MATPATTAAAAAAATAAATAALNTFIQDQAWSVPMIMRAGVVMAKALRDTPGMNDHDKVALICKTLDTLLGEALVKVGESNETEAKLLAKCKKCVETLLPVTLELTLDAASGSFEPAKMVAGVVAAVTKPGFWSFLFCRGPASVVTEPLSLVAPAPVAAAAAAAAAAAPVAALAAAAAPVAALAAAAAPVAALAAAAAAAPVAVVVAPESVAVAVEAANSTQTPPKESESQAEAQPSPEPLPKEVAPVTQSESGQ